MASLKPFETGEVFINIDHQVGLNKANFGDDVLVVQVLLAIIFNESDFKDDRPTAPATPSRKLDPRTPVLIAHFQRVRLNRLKPEGFVNSATRGDIKNLLKSTIFILCDTAKIFANDTDLTHAALIARVKRENPSLAGLKSRPGAGGVETVDRGRSGGSHFIDSSR